MVDSNLKLSVKIKKGVTIETVVYNDVNFTVDIINRFQNNAIFKQNASVRFSWCKTAFVCWGCHVSPHSIQTIYTRVKYSKVNRS